MALIPDVTEETRRETVQRSFFYYDIKPLKKNNDGDLQGVENKEEILYSVYESIDALIANDELDKLTVRLESGDRIYVIPDAVERGEPIKFRIVLVRMNGFPFVEQEGALTSLTDYIKDDFGLAEITHCVIFPDYGILGAEYNNSGARPAAIKEYLPRVSSELDSLYCAPHMNEDVLEKIIDDKEYSLFQLEIRNTTAMKKYIADSQSAFLMPFISIPDVGKYEVVMKRAGKKRGFKAPMNKEEMRDFITSCGEDITTFKVCQEGWLKDAVDLLGQRVVYKTGVLSTKNKSIDTEAAYKIIIDYFNISVKSMLEIRMVPCIIN